MQRIKKWFVTVDPIDLVFSLLLIAIVAIGIFAIAKSIPIQTKEFEYRDLLVQTCLESERYTRAECIELVGSR